MEPMRCVRGSSLFSVSDSLTWELVLENGLFINLDRSRVWSVLNLVYPFEIVSII